MSRRSVPTRARPRLRGTVSDSPRFVVDAMLGSLSRKLRIFGFDTLYSKEGTDDEMIRIVRDQGRILLTADVALWERLTAIGGDALLVKGADDRSRMSSLLGVPGFSARLALGESRCSVCNGELEKVARRVAVASLSSGQARHRYYYRCTACGKLYWHGKHWERLRRLSYQLKERKRLT